MWPESVCTLHQLQLIWKLRWWRIRLWWLWWLWLWMRFQWQVRVQQFWQYLIDDNEHLGFLQPVTIGQRWWVAGLSNLRESYKRLQRRSYLAFNEWLEYRKPWPSWEDSWYNSSHWKFLYVQARKAPYTQRKKIRGRIDHQDYWWDDQRGQLSETKQERFISSANSLWKWV